MKDLKSFMAQYDLRSEFEKVLGSPQLRTARTLAWKCPFHDDSTPSCHVYKDHYYCFGCEAHGDLLDFWAWSRNVPLEQVIRELSPEPLSPQEQQRIATEQAQRTARELEEKIKEAQKALEELKKAQNWMRYYDNLTDASRALWRQRGIPDDWQNFWKMGYCPSCPTYHQSPSLTIPIIKPGDKDPANVRHRLLEPPSPGDKYRPELAGLPAVPFYADPDLPPSRAERVIVLEGEIKAGVAFLTLDTPLVQVIGTPGKGVWKMLVDELKGLGNVWILFDPDGYEKSAQFAHELGGARVVKFQHKLDDAINQYGLDRNWLNGLLQTGRMVC